MCIFCIRKRSVCKYYMTNWNVSKVVNASFLSPSYCLLFIVSFFLLYVAVYMANKGIKLYIISFGAQCTHGLQ